MAFVGGSPATGLWLEVPKPNLSSKGWSLVAVASAFATYYCMYGFRKPFTVLAFEGDWWGGVQLKTAIVTSQLIGYFAAKILGTRICSGLHRERIFPALMICILGALGSLALLPLLPWNLGVLALALNGLALGMVWGMVMRPLEGRGNSEFLLAGLCCSFIIASGDVKTVGNQVLVSSWFADYFGSDLWMPFATACLYLVPFAIAAFALSKVPLPGTNECIERHERHAMNREDRWQFIRSLWLPLLPLAITFFLLTSFRDYRDNFQADLFIEVGVSLNDNTRAFSNSERLIAFAVVSVTALVMLIKRHLLALQTTHIVMAVALSLPAVAVFLRESGIIDGFTWMILSGTGAYIPYILIHCVIFERLVAFTKVPGNSVFALMLFDAIGYVGPILMIPLSDWLGSSSRLAVFDTFTFLLSAVGILCMLLSIFLTPRLHKDHV